MSRPSSLSRRIGLGLLGYALLLTAAVLVHGVVVNETAERLVWQSLLNAELDHFLARRAADPTFQWSDTETLELHVYPLEALPDVLLAGLPPGLHDEVEYQDRELVVQVRDVGDQRIVLALDISDLERQERRMAWAIMFSTAVLVVALALVAAWSVRRLVRPLSALKERIATLDPEDVADTLEAPKGSSIEIMVIVDALNAYLARNRAFVERERAFIDTASHELRTPVAVMAGAAELALAQPGLDPMVGGQLHRILHTARGVDRLVSLLLVLAKTPERLSSMADRVSLLQLVPEIIEDHRHLCEGKALELAFAPADGVEGEIVAPLIIVQAAIGNLLRNAIENSDRGTIRIGIEPGPVVVIEDPGHGMSPEEISRLYRELAKGGRRDRGGIGLALIGRLCEHLGWQLSIDPAGAEGTRVRLDLAGATA